MAGFACGLLLAVLAACSTDVDVPATPGIAYGEAQCELLDLPCGKVYDFADGLELCVLEEDLSTAEAEHGAARLSARLGDRNICLWRCDGEPGCNALSGCWGCS